MMHKFTYKIVLFLGVILLLASCGKTNWYENYREREKSPFGTYIVYNEAKDLFEGEEIVYLKQNFYDYLFENYDVTTPNFGNYICIKNDAYWLSKDAVKELLSFVADGNTAFMALNSFNESLKKQLEFTTNNLDKDVFGISNLRKLEGSFTFTNSNLVSETYKFDRNIRRHYFLEYNKNKTIVLGNAIIDGEDVPNFIKIYHGKGAIYLHSNPVAFTNYYLLNDKENYVANVFSYLPSSTILWDPQIKRSKYSNQSDKDNSVFTFFLQNQSLTWYLVVTMLGILLFMLFNARRKQRAIPIIHPLENTTVAFTQTIASLYLKEGNHKNLVDKKISFFLEKVRTKYLLNTNNLNKEFIKNLASKSGNTVQNTKYLINTIITLHKKSECSEEELVVLHKMIEKFLKK